MSDRPPLPNPEAPRDIVLPPFSSTTLHTTPRPTGPLTAAPGDRPRFLSEADCHAIAQRLERVAEGGGVTAVAIWSHWTGNVRWARNTISTSGETRNNYIKVDRDLRGARNGWVLINDTSDAALVAAARRAERLAQLEPEVPEWELIKQMPMELGALSPSLFSEATYQLDAEHRAQAAIALAKSAADAGMLSAGYIEVTANCQASIDSLGRARYSLYTCASYSVTVRDPSGSGSGWAGVDWQDWDRVHPSTLSAIALDKCLKSRNPVAVEPGRYTTILEPQAVCDFVGQLFYHSDNVMLGKGCSEGHACNPRSPFFKAEDKFIGLGISQLGDKVVDERITIGADPMDPELGFPPFNLASGARSDRLSWINMDVYHPATWIKDGVLTQLAYEQREGVEWLGLATGLPNEGAFRMSGGATSLDEMIETTQRGLLVTHFSDVMTLDETSLLYRGYTRDGLWLIEHGKISKPVKNLVFTESILFALNNVEQLGIPQRVYHPVSASFGIPQPVIVPPLKVKDFSFTALADAV